MKNQMFSEPHKHQDLHIKCLKNGNDVVKERAVKHVFQVKGSVMQYVFSSLIHDSDTSNLLIYLNELMTCNVWI